MSPKYGSYLCRLHGRLCQLACSMQEAQPSLSPSKAKATCMETSNGLRSSRVKGSALEADTNSAGESKLRSMRESARREPQWKPWRCRFIKVGSSELHCKCSVNTPTAPVLTSDHCQGTAGSARPPVLSQGKRVKNPMSEKQTPARSKVLKCSRLPVPTRQVHQAEHWALRLTTPGKT